MYVQTTMETIDENINNLVYTVEKNHFHEMQQCTFARSKIHDTDATNRQYYLQEMLLGQIIRMSVKSNLKYNHIIWKLVFFNLSEKHERNITNTTISIVRVLSYRSNSLNFSISHKSHATFTDH